MSKISFLWLGLVLISSSAFARDIDLNKEEYAAVVEYRALKANPKNAKVADAKLQQQAAKSVGLKTDAFATALKKMDGYGDELGKKAEAVLREKLSGTVIGKRLQTVLVDTSDPHAVVGVSFRQGNALDIDDEVSTAAAVVKDEIGFVGTFAIWVVDDADKKVFTAKIGHAAMQNIQLAKIKDFGKTRYIKLFEEVKRGKDAEAAAENDKK